MASPRIWSSGFGLTGPQLLKAKAAYLTGLAWFVDEATGVDGAALAGTNPAEPLATLAQALTNVAAEGGMHVIIVAAGHTETLTAGFSTTEAGTVIIGGGSGSTRPKFTVNGVINLFDSVQGLQLENLYFPLSTAAATSRVNVDAANCVIKDCYFECGANDANSLSVVSGGDSLLVEGCSFVAAGTSLAAQPGVGLSVSAAVSDLTVRNCYFQGGTYGWSNGGFVSTAAITRLKAEGIDADRISAIRFTATGTTGYLVGRDDTNDTIRGRLEWEA